MKNLITKPIDFTGCHPEIAEALKQGLSVRCMVWDKDLPKGTAEVFFYNVEDGTSARYYALDESNSWEWWDYAEPIKTKRVLRPVKETIPLLLENGWIFNEDHLLELVDTEGYKQVISPRWLQGIATLTTEAENIPDYLFMEVEE